LWSSATRSCAVSDATAPCLILAAPAASSPSVEAGHSADKLKAQSRTAFQSHTYAGSSARALANGASLLNSLTDWRSSILAVEAGIAPIIAELNEAAAGALIAHGQGCLWGGLFAHNDPAERTKANLDFKERCEEARVLPYFVPVGGFMLTPRYDDPETFAEAVKDMAACALETVRKMDWDTSVLLPSQYLKEKVP